tara:strand:+ start:10194 stop:11075 length:882 start_codon:yes stop_codon:yes gene_type:complete
MSLRSVPTAGDYLLLAALALMWGAAFLLIKIAVATVPPFTIVVGRLVIATALMLTYLVLLGDRLPATRGAWTWFALMGLFGNVIPFALIGWGEIRIDSGLAAILVATVPLFTAVLAHFFTDDEPLSLRRFAGISLGLVGVVVLIGWEALAGLGATVLSQLAIIGAALSYACTNIIARQVTTGSTASASAAALICATVWAVPVSAVVDRPWNLTPSWDSLLAVAALGVLSTTLAYIVYFRLVRSVGATFVSFVNYLIPPIGVGLGVMIAGETPSLRSLLALLIIFTGIAAARRP